MVSLNQLNRLAHVRTTLTYFKSKPGVEKKSNHKFSRLACYTDLIKTSNINESYIFYYIQEILI
jgi:hypothetical protein